MGGWETTHLWRRPMDRIAQALPGNHLLHRVELWIAVGLLALSGWFVDSLLTGIQMHRLSDVGLRVHLSHLWYGPPLLAAALLFAQRRRPRTILHPDGTRAFSILARGLRPETKTLAAHLTGSETKAALVAFFRRYALMAPTAADLAYYVGREQGEVEEALADLVTLGLVEAQRACDLTFYRLVRDDQQLAMLDELVAWQEGWLERAQHLAHTVGPSLAGRDRMGKMVSIAPDNDATSE